MDDFSGAGKLVDGMLATGERLPGWGSVFSNLLQLSGRHSWDGLGPLLPFQQSSQQLRQEQFASQECVVSAHPQEASPPPLKLSREIGAVQSHLLAPLLILVLRCCQHICTDVPPRARAPARHLRGPESTSSKPLGVV